ncbi:MAG: NAD(P)-binding protein, partial [Gemmatimonadaceae bacterium]
MEIDATPVTSEAITVAEICIIGSGPAGLVLAAELCRRGRDVLLLESGTHATDAAVVRHRAQELNEGSCVGDSYAGLSVTRHRSVGGTTSLWNTPTRYGAGAKYVPLDPWDFEPRWPEASDGWPISFEQLLPFYERAQSVCGLGAFEHKPDLPRSSNVSPITIGKGVESGLYQMGARDSLITPLLEVLRNSPNARIMTNATVTAVRAQASHTTVRVADQQRT